MYLFSKDIDLLAAEPSLFIEAYRPCQVISKGANAQLAQTALTAAGANFTTAQVQPGDVIYLTTGDGLIDGCFEIVSVNSATQLTVSILRHDSTLSPIPIGTSSSVLWRICTYRPQAAVVSLQIAGQLGIADETILNPQDLRQASAFGVLSGLFAALSQGTGASDTAWHKHRYYTDLHQKAMVRCRILLDTNADGFPDSQRLGGVITLKRD